VTGIDLASSSIRLAAANAAHERLRADLAVADGEALPFREGSFDLVYAHGVVQYTTDDRALVAECRRVLKPGGVAIFQVYNRVSWLNALSQVTKVDLEHVDAPMLKKYSIREFRDLLSGFSHVRIVPERFPVKTRLHGGLKGVLYNTCFVGLFNMLPRRLTRRYGWHLLAFCEV
jgi:SAM-dependent methyltransferase